MHDLSLAFCLPVFHLSKINNQNPYVIILLIPQRFDNDHQCKGVQSAQSL